MRQAEHTIAVRAAAVDVFALLADLESWPWVFPSFVHTRSLGVHDGHERVGMWTTSDDEVHHWVVLRTVRREELRIDFRPEVCPPGLAALTRSWIVDVRSDREALVRLRHEYRPADDDPRILDEIARQMTSVADGELAACKAAAELRPDLFIVLEDTEHIAGTPDDVWTFLRDVERWPGVVPHIARAAVRGAAADLSIAEVDVRGPRGVFPTRAARVCLQPHTIAQKQLLLPPIGRVHHTRWTIAAAPGRAHLTTRHTVVLDPSGIGAVLGPAADIASAHEFVEREVRGKGRAIVRQAKKYAEAVMRRSPRPEPRRPSAPTR